MKNWSHTGSQNNTFHPETLPERIRGAGSILHWFTVPFWIIFCAIGCRFRHPFRWIGAGPTFKPRKQTRRFLKGCGGYAPRLQGLLASLLASIFDLFKNLQNHKIHCEINTFDIQHFIVFHACSKPLLGLFLECPGADFYWKLDFSAIFGFRDFPKAFVRHHFRPKRIQRRGVSSYSERPCRDPAIHETIVITVPLGPTRF